MFENKRYMTRGFQQEISLELQLTIFQLIDELKIKSKMDYLQVFELSKEGYIQVLEHRMEEPEYKKIYRFAFTRPVTAKVFVIDDGDHTTVMLAEEY
ncbi:hypothetical protein PM10SUCC1_19280 [Propionigenium maris DSM 9537]|uniref:DUF960 domain-containing protein n=1 Tax=Propionigenium maris DSM 9537 TaxID=1123000 RepID=A0A9W6GM86_9FUSO|nr:DUF960 domain-containing protein [Propionigenium maris]GLI56414.1 hypothetical protein PM10SUCC1_19280 [Propionigenium maris DSM 9537]